MRISDWSSDVCSSDLVERFDRGLGLLFPVAFQPLPLLRRAHVQKAGGLPQRRRDQEAPGAVIDMDRRVQLLGTEADRHRLTRPPDQPGDRKRVVWGKRVEVRVERGGRRTIKKNKYNNSTV